MSRVLTCRAATSEAAIETLDLAMRTCGRAALCCEVMVVHDALVLLAAGSLEPARVAQGHDRVMALHAAMNDARQQRLGRIGFTSTEAAVLSELHTRNFM